MFSMFYVGGLKGTYVYSCMYVTSKHKTIVHTISVLVGTCLTFNTDIEVVESTKDKV